MEEVFEFNYINKPNEIYASCSISSMEHKNMIIKFYRNNNVVKELTISNGEIISSKVVLRGRLHQIDYPEKDISYTVSTEEKGVIESILGMIINRDNGKVSISDKGSLSLDNHGLTISSKFGKRDDTDKIVLLGLTEIKDKEGNKVSLINKDTIPGGTLEAVLTNKNGLEYCRKIFRENINIGAEISIINDSNQILKGNYKNGGQNPPVTILHK